MLKTVSNKGVYREGFQRHLFSINRLAKHFHQVLSSHEEVVFVRKHQNGATNTLVERLLGLGCIVYSLPHFLADSYTDQYLTRVYMIMIRKKNNILSNYGITEAEMQKCSYK